MKTLQRGFIPVLIAIIAVLIIGGGAAYYKVSTKHKTTQVPTSAVQQPQPVVNVPAPAPVSVAGGPKAAYLAMRADFDSAQSLDQYLAITLKYATQEKIAEFGAKKAQLAATPQTTKDAIFSTMRAIAPKVSDMTSISETINGTTATLNITTNISSPVTGRTTAGTVTMKQEGGVWKLELESWKG